MRNVVIAVWWEARYNQAYRRGELAVWLSRETWWYYMVLGYDDEPLPLVPLPWE